MINQAEQVAKPTVTMHFAWHGPFIKEGDDILVIALAHRFGGSIAAKDRYFKYPVLYKGEIL
jgi:hypothetical protein